MLFLVTATVDTTWLVPPCISVATRYRASGPHRTFWFSVVGRTDERTELPTVRVLEQRSTIQYYPNTSGSTYLEGTRLTRFFAIETFVPWGML